MKTDLAYQCAHLSLNIDQLYITELIKSETNESHRDRRQTCHHINHEEKDTSSTFNPF